MRTHDHEFINWASAHVDTFQLPEHMELYGQVPLRYAIGCPEAPGDCSQNDCSPQPGTWQYARGGWCPGDKVVPRDNDVTAAVTPSARSSSSGGRTSPAPTMTPRQCLPGVSS